jgi:hypothetical protein
MAKFTIYTAKDNIKRIEHHEHPKFIAKLVFKDPFIDIEDVILLDQETDPNKLATLMREAGYYVAKVWNSL